MADREELCSIQVEPSSSQHQQAPSTEEGNDSSQRQDVDPQHDDHSDNSSQGNLDSFSRMSSGAKSITQGRSVQTTLRQAQLNSRRVPDQDQGQSLPLQEENDSNDDQGQVNGQDEDQTDEVIPTRNNKEIHTRLKAKMDRMWN